MTSRNWHKSQGHEFHHFNSCSAAMTILKLKISSNQFEKPWFFTMSPVYSESNFNENLSFETMKRTKVGRKNSLLVANP